MPATLETEQITIRATRQSTKDVVTKFIVDFDGIPTEFTYVDNLTGKDIICVPSQTGCNLGCRFCHLTARQDQIVRQLRPAFTTAAIERVVAMKGRPDANKTLLTSFMGMGEPLLCVDHLASVAGNVYDQFKDTYSEVRFGAATIIPTARLIENLTNRVCASWLPLKLHWSLHHVDDSKRHEIMPCAVGIQEGAALLTAYRDATRNPVEVHYTIFDGNDTEECAKRLGDLMLTNSLHVKFLQFSERPDKVVGRSATVERFMNTIDALGVSWEAYAPPGADVQAACGEFELTVTPAGITEPCAR